LISGPAYNKPYGHVWVDIDGPSVYGLVEKISGQTFAGGFAAYVDDL
jgi:hypothetical protein